LDKEGKNGSKEIKEKRRQIGGNKSSTVIYLKL